MKYDNVLVAVDSTDDAEDVLISAMLLAKDHTEIHIVTVVEMLSHIYGNSAWLPILSDAGSVEDSLIEYNKSHLCELALRHGLSIDNVHVVLGSPAKSIRKLAGNLGADLIVIGTHGRHGLGLILGSTANSVLHGVNQDVLVVRLSNDGE